MLLKQASQEFENADSVAGRESDALVQRTPDVCRVHDLSPCGLNVGRHLRGELNQNVRVERVQVSEHNILRWRPPKWVFPGGRHPFVQRNDGKVRPAPQGRTEPNRLSDLPRLAGINQESKLERPDFRVDFPKHSGVSPFRLVVDPRKADRTGYTANSLPRGGQYSGLDDGDLRSGSQVMLDNGNGHDVEDSTGVVCENQADGTTRPLGSST